jgi:AcrR family transcriptional regulator
MVSSAQPPTGAARRRVRISDEETERRMLDAAAGLIADRGMSVSLEHLSLEEIIQAAGVARSSVYRRWPYKDLFFSDLLVELASATALAQGWSGMVSVVEEFLADELARPRGGAPEQDRIDFVVEFLRVIAAVDFAQVADSHQWRTYIALHATHLGLPHGELRRQVGAALARSERRLTELRATILRRFAPLAGYRLIGRPDPEEGFRMMSVAVGAAVTGLIVKSFADADLAGATRRLAPFGTSRPADWTDAQLVQVHLFLSYLEPDPEVSWSGENLRALAHGVRELAAEPPPEATRLGWS